jgi:hypothetical protein
MSRDLANQQAAIKATYFSLIGNASLALIKGLYFKRVSNEASKEEKLPFFIPFAKHEELCDLESQSKPLKS